MVKSILVLQFFWYVVWEPSPFYLLSIPFHFTCKNVLPQSTKLSQTMQCSTFIIWLLNLPKGCGSYLGPYMAWPQRHLNSCMTSLKIFLRKQNTEQNEKLILFKKMRNCFTTSLAIWYPKHVNIQIRNYLLTNQKSLTI